MGGGGGEGEESPPHAKLLLPRNSSCVPEHLLLSYLKIIRGEEWGGGGGFGIKIFLDIYCPGGVNETKKKGKSV